VQGWGLRRRGGGSCFSWTMTTWFAPALDPDAHEQALAMPSPLDGGVIQTRLTLAR
jgi:hypothetical protein